MPTALPALLLLASTLASPAPRQPLPAAPPPPDAISSERAIETNSLSVQWPSGSAGVLGVTTCSTCAKEQHATSAATEYLLGNRAVTLAEFVRAVQGGAPVAVTVYLDLHSGLVSRVMAPSPAPAKTGKRP